MMKLGSNPNTSDSIFFFVFLSDFYLQLEFFIYLFFLKAEFHEEIHFGCPT